MMGRLEAHMLKKGGPEDGAVVQVDSLRFFGGCDSRFLDQAFWYFECAGRSRFSDLPRRSAKRRTAL